MALASIGGPLPTQSRKDIGPQDVGGVEENYSPIDTSVHEPQHWELRVHAAMMLCMNQRYMNTDELRRGIESLDAEVYANTGYYEKWTVSMAKNLLEKGVLRPEALDEEFGISGGEAGPPLFRAGDRVRIRAENTKMRWRKPHLRTPGYIFGMEGEIERYCGVFHDPMLGAFGRTDAKINLYRVRFSQKRLWPEYKGPATDMIDVEVYENWLETSGATPAPQVAAPAPSYGDRVELRWDGGWTQVHPNRVTAEKMAVEKEGPPARLQGLAEGLISVLIKEKIFSQQDLQTMMDKVAPTFRDGAATLGRQLIAKAWADPGFKALLVLDPHAGLEKIGLNGSFGPQGPGSKLIVAENTETCHNLVVCTLCSCYPSSLLGNPPAWYKSRSYRARAVREPREVLKDTFGLELPNAVRVQVHDSSADMRYIVLPRKPADTDGWTEEQLVKLITRDCMIGAGLPLPATAGKL